MSDTSDDESVTSTLTVALSSVIAGAAVTALVAGILSELTELLATNYTERRIDGNTTYAPTEEETVLDKQETAAAQTESSLASDETSAQKGTIDAQATDAQAQQTKAEANTTGACAAQVDTGASEIGSKGLKIN